MTSRGTTWSRTHLPEELLGRSYYEPSGQGFELEIEKRIKERHRPPHPDK